MTETTLAIISYILAIILFNFLVESRMVRNSFALFLAFSLAFGGLI